MNEIEARIGAVIVAAGTGSRMTDADPTPKQFRELNGSTVLALATKLFLDRGCDPVVVVVAVGYEEQAQAALNSMADRVTIVAGGATRHASALAGVQACAAPLIHIHDAARPFVTNGLIERVEERMRAGEVAAVLPVLPVNDTVKVVDGDFVRHSADRSELRLAQTPQLVQRSAYLNASADVPDEAKLTDDVSVLERVGANVATVAGDSSNTKLTTPSDFADARQSAGGGRIPDIRVGHGYDTHRTTVGKSVWLCGIEIDAPFRLDGHSDADVGLHALTDALLGTCGEGDIGSHFPPSDPRWAGASSDQFLQHARSIVTARNGTINAVDITIICERPKVGPHRSEMREAVAGILALTLDRVSVKATTNERIGFVGRNEGIAAFATATVCYD